MSVKKLTRWILYIGSPEKHADIAYLTGFRAPGTVILVTRGNARHLLVSDLELGRARRTARDCRVWSVGELGLNNRTASSIENWACVLLRKLDVKNVDVPGYLPVRYAEAIGKKTKVRISKTDACRERETKTKEEISCIRSSQKAAVRAMNTAVQIIRRSVVSGKGELKYKGKFLTSEKLRAEIDKTLLELNCIGCGTIVACGAHAADPHETGSGVLRAGRTIVMDIFPRNQKHGYWGDLTRTVVKGKATKEACSMYTAVKAAQKKALKHVKPGVCASTVHRFVVNEFEKRGFETCDSEGFIHSTGHGVGLDIHESPTLGNNPKRLRKGNAITVEPGLYYRSEGGVRIEDLVIVTSNGFEYAARCADVFEIDM